MNETDGNPWFNFQYKVADNSRSNPTLLDDIKRGDVIPHPVGMKMTLDQYIEAEGKLRKSSRFLELETHKLESPQYDVESVKRINDIVAVFGGSKPRTLPDATTDMGFGERHLTIYACRDQSGIVTVKGSTGNRYDNEIGLYGFTESGFKKTVNGLGLPI